MEGKTVWKERFRYWLDNQFARGTGMIMFWLWVFSFVLIFLIAGVVWLAGITPKGEDPLGFWEAAWRSLMHAIDPGTSGGDAGWQYRITMFFVTLGGLFFISALIGVITTGIGVKLNDLRKGRSRVLESKHTIILGWSEQIFTILNELKEANSKVKNACLVVMGNAEKPDMEDKIHKKVDHKGKTRIVCRNGNPSELTDMNLVSLSTAKAIVVLPPGGDNPDSEVIKTILAVTNHPRWDISRRTHIVAEIVDKKNMEIAAVVGKGQVEWIFVGDFIAHVIAQTSRQSGLSVVYTELLNCAGDEIYFYEEPRLTGQPFSQALLAFPKNAVMGICPAGGEPKLNPPQNQVIQTNDQLILIAEDKDQIRYQPKTKILQSDQIGLRERQKVKGESILILGWNQHGAAIVNGLEKYVPEDSHIMIVATQSDIENQMAQCCSGLKRLKFQTRQDDTTDRGVLDSLGLSSFDHIILLCYSDLMNVQQADAKTLITLLHLRDIANKTDCHFTLVSEMLDVHDRNLADITRADDFIVSDKLVSLMMAQVTENRKLNAVFKDLLDPEGSEIYLKPAGEYVQPDVGVDFYTVVAAASKRGETALGYRLHCETQDVEKMYGVHLNPPKDSKVTFKSGDRIILLAEE